MINESLQPAKHGSKHGSHGLKTLLAVFSKERRLSVSNCYKGFPQESWNIIASSALSTLSTR